MKTLISAVILSLASFNADALECRGTEPSWRANLTNQTVNVEVPNSESMSLTVTDISGVAGYQSDFIQVYTSSNGPLAVVTSNKCNDGMSDETFPHEVILFTNGGNYYGCCGDALESDPEQKLRSLDPEWLERPVY